MTQVHAQIDNKFLNISRYADFLVWYEREELIAKLEDVSFAFAHHRMARVTEGINPTQDDIDTLALMHELIQAIREIKPLK